MKTLKLNQPLMTAGIENAFNLDSMFISFVMVSLERHKSLDWGDVDSHDLRVNNESFKTKNRIVSVYNVPKTIQRQEHPDDKIWIITDSGHEVTTILWPSEY